MLKSRIEIELPRVEIQRGMGPIEWVRSLLGETIDLRSGQAQTTIGAFSLIEALYQGFSRARITDAVSFLIDRRMIYVDTQEITHDLHLVWEAAQQRGVLDRPFQEMHLVLTEHHLGLHLLYDVRLTAKVWVGDPHLTVEISARPEELRIRQGETALEYRERLHHISADESLAEGWRGMLAQHASELAEVLARRVPGARAEVPYTRVELVRPGPQQLAQFRQLGFGADVVEPSYRPVPSRARHGAYADPFPYYWYDPYWDFTSYLLIDAMLHHHHWQTPVVTVVDPQGQALFDGSTAGDHGLTDPYLGAVSYHGDGISVSDAIPDAGHWGGSDVGTSDGWGGSDLGSAADAGGEGWGGSDIGGGGSDGGGTDGGSSCGSSCGGSSCGGGCGGD